MYKVLISLKVESANLSWDKLNDHTVRMFNEIDHWIELRGVPVRKQIVKLPGPVRATISSRLKALPRNVRDCWSYEFEDHRIARAFKLTWG